MAHVKRNSADFEKHRGTLYVQCVYIESQY